MIPSARRGVEEISREKTFDCAQGAEPAQKAQKGL